MADPDYFTLEELRARKPLDDESLYPDDLCLAAAAYITEVIEREVGTSFVVRTVTDEAHDGDVSSIILRKPYIQSVTSATENGVTVADNLYVRDGVLIRAATGATTVKCWRAGFNNVLVTYAAGYSTEPPADVKEQAIRGTRAYLLESSDKVGMNDRRTSINNESGTINFITAGEDQPTGYPAVDAMIAGWRRRIGPLGVA